MADGIPGYTLQETILVPTDSPDPVMSTTTLVAGIVYKIRASGVTELGTPKFGDAEWGFDSGPNPNPRDCDNIDIGIGINDTALDASKFPFWGPFDPSHVYTIDFVGLGAPIKLNYHDCDYKDNSGDPLTVEIFAPEPCQFGSFTVNCFLSDAQGNPLDPFAEGSVSCREIPQPGGVRQNVSVVLPSGETATLQKVKVAKEGFVTVQAVGVTSVMTLAIVPFFVSEKFFLCAPPGTMLVCHVTNFECDSLVRCDVNGNFTQLDISITMCQDIQMEAPVKIEINATTCEPRAEIQVACPPRVTPASCSAVFPSGAEELDHETIYSSYSTSRHIQGRQQETICINVQKVFDWVTRQVDVPLITVSPVVPPPPPPQFGCCGHADTPLATPPPGTYTFNGMEHVATVSGDVNICPPGQQGMCHPQGSHINLVFHSDTNASFNINEHEITSIECIRVDDVLVGMIITATASLKVGTTTISPVTFTIDITATQITITSSANFSATIGPITPPVNLTNCNP